MPWGPEGSGLRVCPAPPRMLQSVRELEATSSGAGAKAAAFQHLLLLVGIYLFKVWQLGSGAPQLSSRRGGGWGVLWVDHSPRRVAPCTSWPVVS